MQSNKARSGHIVELKADEAIEIKNGAEVSYFLILEGKPINEPAVQHGPFVMNTEEEIKETMLEYGGIQFGVWTWPQQQIAHLSHKGSFALHSDGREEVRKWIV